MSKRNTVKFELDTDKPPPITAAQRRKLAAIAKRPDSAIDYSDIPKQDGPVKWTRLGALVSGENKQQITLRVDAEVLMFFKKSGLRYQSRINAVLREYVRAQQGAG